MLQDSILIRQRYDRFIRKVTETENVWVLKSKTGFATSSSNNIEKDDGDSIEVICFWSEKALAKSCAKDEWSEYEPIQIPLNEFIESWCIGMYYDGLIVGINLDQNMFGYESAPLELIVEIIKEIKTTNKKILLEEYSNIDELLDKINLILINKASH